MSAMASQITGVSIVCSKFYLWKIKAPRHWPLWGESTGDRWILITKASNAENVSISWRHNGDIESAIWRFNTLRPEENQALCRRHFQMHIPVQKLLYFDSNFLEFVPRDSVHNTLLRVMAWGGSMMTHICVTGPDWILHSSWFCLYNIALFSPRCNVYVAYYVFIALTVGWMILTTISPQPHQFCSCFWV